MKTSNRVLTVIFITVLLVGVLSTSVAEPFSIRNGIHFGMTLEELMEIETLPFMERLGDSDNYKFGYGSIAGIENSYINYTVNQETGLSYIVMTFDEGNTNEWLFWHNYDEVNDTLRRRYGDALPYSNGETYSYKGSALKFLDLARTLQILSTDYQDKYNEWVIEQDGYTIKIEHIAVYVTVANTTTSHQVAYEIISNTDLEKDNDL